VAALAGSSTVLGCGSDRSGAPSSSPAARLPPIEAGAGPSGDGLPLVSVRPVTIGPEPSPPLGVDPADLPTAVVTADGWLLAPGRSGTSDDALAVPARRLDAEAVAHLRRLLASAGLLTPPPASPQPERAVAAVEIAATDERGGLAVHRVVGPTVAQQEVLDALGDPPGVLGGAHVGPPAAYAPVAYRVTATPSAGGGGPAPPWPVPDLPLALASSCTVLRDGPAAALAAGLRAAPSGSRRGGEQVFVGRWESGGAAFDVPVRPLLPGEQGCPDLP